MFKTPCQGVISYLCLVDAPSPATAFSCLSSFPDLLISLSALGDGVATGVEGGVTGDMLPIETLGRSGDSISMCLFLQKQVYENANSLAKYFIIKFELYVILKKVTQLVNMFDQKIIPILSNPRNYFNNETLKHLKCF